MTWVIQRGLGLTWTEASKLMGAFCRKASAGVSLSLLRRRQGHQHHAYL